ncbi:paraquat-inducible protein A [Roseomonas sp. GC11]|uniref:paraquat-inducible protein A n=1 Tax=Roseomonas sp. GC11 TaxID=2950546 RepID=UPI00210C143B|nr:paraquat-inducible protein A [Roseomonas sp. GC11]MCQ4158815.1 paraquat-inducible protein A [Roseomonas sp. GC11]
MPGPDSSQTQGSAAPSQHLQACPHCGLAHRLSAPRPGTASHCRRCHALLRRTPGGPRQAALPLAALGLLLGLAALPAPLLSLHLHGLERDGTLGTGARAFAEDGLWLLGLLLLATVALAPLLRLGLRLVVLAGLASGRPPRWLFHPLRWEGALAAWCMPGIFLVGGLMACVRLAMLADLRLGPAAWLLAALALVALAADEAFDPLATWEALEARGAVADPSALAATATAPHGARPWLACPCCHRLAAAAPATTLATLAARAPGWGCARCGTPLHPRKPAALARSTALLATAALLSLPANLWPVMGITTFGQEATHTILGGVLALGANGYPLLALLLFLASIVVPLVKILGLAAMLLRAAGLPAPPTPALARLHRLISALGRWSMTDVFVVAVLIAMVRFGALASITAGPGAGCFAAVVVLTMLAAHAFDPRLMWDAPTRATRARERAA